MRIFTFLLCSLLTGVWGESLCPAILRYEERKAEEPDKIYGTITTSTDETLEGVWLKIFFDRKVIALGNSFSDAISRDNKEFNVRNPDYRFSAGPPILIRFFVKYDTADVPPNIIKINLNGRVICPSSKAVVLQDQSTWHVTGEDHRNPDHRRQWQNRRPDNSDSNHRGQSGENVDNGNRPQHNNQAFNNERPTSQEDYNNRGTLTNHRAIQCGTVAQRASPLITNAQETAPGQWPWHAALYLIGETELKYSCGGTLISDQHVVTAAHCVTKPRTTQIVQKTKLVLYFGKYNLIRFDGEVQNRGIDSITVYPEYNATVLYNDIAVIKLDSPVEINNFIRPCCLWEDEDTNLEKVVGQKGTVIGWGYNEQGQLSQNLMKAEMPIISTSTCLFSNRDFFSIFLSDKNFCAGFKNGTAVCNGDSGGGMVLPRHGTRGENTVWQLRGLVSIGVARQTQAICDSKQYSIFTDVSKYVSWIKRTMGVRN